jgi:hypothetical protein
MGSGNQLLTSQVFVPESKIIHVFYNPDIEGLEKNCNSYQAPDSIKQQVVFQAIDIKKERVIDILMEKYGWDETDYRGNCFPYIRIF